MTVKSFESTRTELLKGVNLIEASAGTGKTYAITMLVLRFVVERNIKLEQQLIVTFTNAATEELKERIRARLSEARRILNGRKEESDKTVLDWADSLVIDKDTAKQRLELALLDIDQAGIFTIHGFCQRVLKEHALESGQLFDSELTGDIEEIKQQVGDDFWREQVYLRSPLEANVLTALYGSPDVLMDSIRSIGRQATVFPLPGNLDDALSRLVDTIEEGQGQATRICKAISDVIPDGKFKGEFAGLFENSSQLLIDWLSDKSRPMPDMVSLFLLTTEGIKQQLNGHKFRKTKEQSGDEKKLVFLSELGLDNNPFNQLYEAVDQVTLFFRRALVDYLQKGLDKRLQQSNVLSYDDLIIRVYDALKSDKGIFLKQELQRRYATALIDEFQDTDQLQWQIFSMLFATDEHFFYLIGDPKQAVYKFRGADIFSYFSAREKARHHYTLKQNWRSHPSLVSAVNQLFQHREYPFLFDQMDYIKVDPALSAEQGTIYWNGKSAAPMVLWQLDKNPENQNGYWTSGKAGLKIQISVANEVLALLNPARPAEIIFDNQSRAIQPQDIAILVRSNKQASEFQGILRQAGIPSVLNSTESVFASPEADGLLVLLQAIVQPGDVNLIKQALTLDWFGLDGQMIYEISNDESSLDLWVSRFHQYYQLWQDKGLMAMMRKLLAEEGVTVQLSRSEMAERRLTNLNHLIELVQQAAVDGHLGIQKVLQWLHVAVIKETGGEEEQQLRLESDENAVKIVTMHRSKGLEYPIVFCPYLWYQNEMLKRERNLVKCHEQGEMVIDLGSDDFEDRKEKALYEELAEDLRLFYVAVTRAKYRCYIVWADVSTVNNPNTSAMAYLFHAEGHNEWQKEMDTVDFSAQQEKLKRYQNLIPEGFEYALLEPVDRFIDYYSPRQGDDRLTFRQQKRSLETSWQMSSYTALSALSLHDAPELPTDKAQEAEDIGKTESADDLLPKGAHTGNVVHDLLEKISFTAIARGDDISVRRDMACQRYGLSFQEPEIIDSLLQKVVRTPLSEDTGFQLAYLEENRCLKEMPFYLSLASVNAIHINHILVDTPAFLPLNSKQMQGYLTGFIDLICEYQGRYYVMDYKTNALPDYEPGTLTNAMKEHNYGLQYWIYTVVLHLYLRQRLENYSYERHFGGVRYLFVRGMQPEKPLSGIYQDRPDKTRLEALIGLLGNER